MTDPPPYSREPTGAPRWAKIVGIALAVVVLLVVAVMLVGGGGHTPRRHGSPDGLAPSTASPVQR